MHVSDHIPVVLSLFVNKHYTMFILSTVAID